VELPVAAGFGLRDRRSLVIVACVSLVTNPILNWIGWALAAAVDWTASPAGVVAFLAPAEIVVVIVEWRLLLWALGGSSRRLLLISAAMNAASALAGVVIFWLL